MTPGTSAQELGPRGCEGGQGSQQGLCELQAKVHDGTGHAQVSAQVGKERTPPPLPTPAHLAGEGSLPLPFPLLLRRGGMEGLGVVGQSGIGQYRLLSPPRLPRRPGPGTRKGSLRGKRTVQIPNSARGKRSMAGPPNPRHSPRCLSSVLPGSLLPQSPQISSSSGSAVHTPGGSPPRGYLLPTPTCSH